MSNIKINFLFFMEGNAQIVVVTPYNHLQKTAFKLNLDLILQLWRQWHYPVSNELQEYSFHIYKKQHL